MGGIFSGLLGSAACCCGSAACSLCCKGCNSCHNSTSTRIAYAFLFLLSSIVAWCMLNPAVEHQLQTMEKYVGKITGAGIPGLTTPEPALTTADPFGNGTTLPPSAVASGWGELGVYRIMFALSSFHLLFSLLMIKVETSRDPRSGLQNGWWLIKLVLLVGGMVGAFFIPNTFFAVWGWIGLVGAFLFIIVQMMLLVDFAHAWNESWVAKAEEGSKCYKWGLLTVSVSLFLVSITATILMYVFYAKGTVGDSCGLSKFFITFNMLMGAATTIASINGKVQEHTPTSGILQAGVIFAYTTYLTWSAVSGVTGPCSSAVGSSTASTVIGAMLTFLAVAYSSLRTSSASQMGKLGLKEDRKLLLDDEEAGLEDEDRPRVTDNEKEGVQYSWTFFHLTFCLAALYLMEVLTDWAVIRDGHNANVIIGEGMASVWVKMVSAWLASLLYLWSLTAPICLPGRDFS